MVGAALVFMPAPASAITCPDFGDLFQCGFCLTTSSICMDESYMHAYVDSRTLDVRVCVNTATVLC